MNHRRGDKWSFVGQASVTDLSGVKVDVSGWQISSELRTSPGGALLAEFTCAWIDPVAQTFSHVATNSAEWPIGPALLDIVIAGPDGEEISTEAVRVDIVDRVTKPK